MKGRKLYWSYTNHLGLLIVVTKIKGNGILKSYGQHHQTKLDGLLQDENFNVDHPDTYLEISNKHTSFYDSTLFTCKNDSKIALDIVTSFYNCTEVIELTTNEFFDLITN